MDAVGQHLIQISVPARGLCCNDRHAPSQPLRAVCQHRYQLARLAIAHAPAIVAAGRVSAWRATVGHASWGVPGEVVMLIASAAWLGIWLTWRGVGRRAQRFLQTVEHRA